MTGETIKPLDPDILLEASRVMNAAGADYANAVRLVSDMALKAVDKADPATRAGIIGDAAALRLRKPDLRDQESEKRYQQALDLLKNIDQPGFDADGRLHMLRALANGQKYNALKRQNKQAKTQQDTIPAATFIELCQDIRKDLAFAFKSDDTAQRDNAGYWQPPDGQTSVATETNDDAEDDLRQVYQDDSDFRALVDEIPGLKAALRIIAPKLDVETWTLPLSRGFTKCGLTTARRRAAALGQFLVEAGDSFQNRIETFRIQSADIGGEVSGDEFRYRGRGLIKLRGRSMYTQFAKAVSMKLEEAVSYCETPEGACVAGCWYLVSCECLPLADKWDIAEITRLVTGNAMEQAAERVALSERALKELGG